MSARELPIVGRDGRDLDEHAVSYSSSMLSDSLSFSLLDTFVGELLNLGFYLLI